MDEAAGRAAARHRQAQVADDAHEWHRTARGWQLAFAVLAAMTGGLLLLDTSLSPIRRIAGMAVLVVLCGWYSAVGRRVLHAERSPAGLIYVAAAIPLTVGLFAIAPVGALMLCMLYPHVWALLPVRQATVATVAALAATAVALVGWTGSGTAQLVTVGAVTVAGLLVSIVNGLWITRIIEQSKRRAALIAELDATRAEVAELSRAAGVMAERERLARDIHDTLAQGFTSVLLLLEAAEAEIGSGHTSAHAHLRRAKKTVQENIAEARAMVSELSPPHLRDASLPVALRQLVDRLGPDLGVESTLAVTGSPGPLTVNEEVVLLRATQEALANVRRHARADRVEVELAYRPGMVTLQITDDGCGFDQEAEASGYGLAGMRARVAELDGTMQVRTAPGAGTTITVCLALPESPAANAAAQGSGAPPAHRRASASTPTLARSGQDR